MNDILRRPWGLTNLSVLYRDAFLSGFAIAAALFAGSYAVHAILP